MEAISLQYLQNNVDPATNPYVTLLGYDQPDDGGEGAFFWDAGATDSVNGGTILDSLYPGAPSGRWKRLHDSVLNVKWFGAKGDGVTDDVAAIQLAIAAMPDDGGQLLFPGGTYLQGDGTNPPFPGTGTDLSFTFRGKSRFRISGFGAVILAHPENTCIPNNKGFYFDVCTDGVVEGLEYNGNIEARHPQGGDTGDYNRQHGFHFDSCQRIRVEQVRSNHCVMDGFFVGSDYIFDNIDLWSEDVSFVDCQANYNYRQGLSVVNAKRVSCVRSEFSYTGTIYGTTPMAGIDFEEGTTSPLGRGQFDCLVDNCLFCRKCRRRIVVPRRYTQQPRDQQHLYQQRILQCTR